MEQAPLRYYHENWWKVENAPIWYLAGRSYDPSQDLQAGKWYFHDEAQMLSDPYNTRKEAEDALNNYTSNL